MFAVIETGGKQYAVTPGKKIKVEKLDIAEGADVVFGNVLLLEENGETRVGAPYVEGASVKARLVKQGREDKKIVFKFHSKARYKKTKGHRQMFTEVEIV